MTKRRGKRLLALGMSLWLPLSGCANLAGRSYETSRRHVDQPVTAEDDSYIRVEDYRSLVSAVLYLVSQGEEEGVIRLYDYNGDVGDDLAKACLEVAAQDPLGAYAVDYIRHEYTRVVSYYQATLSIHYRRTQAQIGSMVAVTGTSAIRTQVRGALSSFAPEVVLRVAYFSEDEDSLAQLIRRAYYDTPDAALGMPEYEIKLYPDSGRERVVEISLTYPESAGALEQKQKMLKRRAEETAAACQGMGERDALEAVLGELAESARYDPEGGPTAYAALVEGAADEEGMALSCALLCQGAGLACSLVEGGRQTGDGEEERWMWNAVKVDGETRYVDLARDGKLRSAQELFDLGYRWAGAPQEEGEE